MPERMEFTALPEDAGGRLDQFLAKKLPDKSRSAIQKLIQEGRVCMADKPLPKNYRPKPGDQVSVEIPDPVELSVDAEPIPLAIVYEDKDLLVVNKPKGMVVHPAAGNYSGTLVNALLHHCGDSLSGINGVIRPGIVHRIDKDTSGLLIVAKNDAAHQGLAQQIKEHSFTREYEAVVYGRVKDDEGTVNLPIGRCPSDRKKMCVTEKNSRPAVTHYRVVERYSQLYPPAAAAGDWAHPSNPGAHGGHWPSGGRGPGIWTQKDHQILVWPVPARPEDRVCPSGHWGVPGVYKPFTSVFY